MGYINSQFSYDTDKEETGGPLFGDGTLSSIKSDLTSLLTQNIWGVDSRFSILGLVGITVDNDLNLSIDDSKLTGYLQTNFNDVLSLFAAQGVTSKQHVELCRSYQGFTSRRVRRSHQQGRTQATETGSVDLSAGGATETLTLTQGDSTAP